MSTEIKTNIINYIAATRWVSLATVRDDGAPVVRAIGGFANDGLTVYFSTPKTAAKVEQIQRHPLVTLFFQHEGQELPAFKNAALIGSAAILSPGADYDRAVRLLSERNPRFKERAAKGDLADDTALVKVTPKEVKFLDFAKGFGPAALQEIIL
ncbi:MAG: pyridoxamine 5'-phosphate oxidase family protein [Verrucomicrobiales bacterium]|jgi:nitroimidazol reductase NimA-like FMN-containing flavoprotein (pyridoxamine 5'-phosphate oxidase superfamily)|nr:pyridoxamine 5'-phosphate oxidase family protein [Verrucomicrobiales bacterium]